MGRKQRGSRGTGSGTSSGRSLDEEELDLEAFSEFLRPFGFAIRDVSNDGNCFFRAVSDQLYGSEEYHMKLRERACDYLERHAEYYKFFIDEEQSFDEYVNEMRADGVWADNLELQAISMAYSINIRVHQSGKPSYDIRNHPGKNANAIHLSYHFGEHYASVRPLRTAELPVPADHEPLPLPRQAPSSSNEDSDRRREMSIRRPRHRQKQDEDSVAAVWKRADRGHCDLCSLVEQTRRAARAIRVSESTSDNMDERRDIARRIEKDMKEARANLEDVGELIREGKSIHRSRTKRILSESQEGTLSANTENADIVSTSSEDEEDDENRYQRTVRHQTDTIFARLNETENAVTAALEKVGSFTADGSAELGHASRHSRSSKRKEQDAKRKDRKDRRRKEQERLAQGGREELRADRVSRSHELDIAI